MHTKFWNCFAAMTLVGGLVSAVPLAAQTNNNHQHHHYQLIVIDTFGGPNSYPFGEDAKALSNGGAFVGQADTASPDPNYGNFNPYVGQNPYLQHAFQRQDGTLTDLGALPGPNTSNAGWVAENGQISGVSTRTTIDPLTGWPEEAAILWKDSQIIDLGTLGGYEAQADANNSRGEVAGFAANTVPDSFPSPICGCSDLPGYGTQQRAFRWKNGVMQDLGTLGGPDSVALLINERGQIAGQSYTTSIPNPGSGVPTVDPFLWTNGTMIDLGGLGGTFGAAGWLNNQGQVVGVSNLAGDAYSHAFLWTKPGPIQDLGTFGGNFGAAIHANDAGEVVGYATNQGDQAVLGFLWKKGVMTNLGTLGSDLCSLGEHINSQHQIVGISSPGCSFSPGDGHAVLWENGEPAIDLNMFVPPGTDLTLLEPVYINDRGEIAGKGPRSDGTTRAFLLIPCDENHPGIEGCDYSMVVTGTVLSGVPTPRKASDRVPLVSRLRHNNRFHFPAIGPGN